MFAAAMSITATTQTDAWGETKPKTEYSLSTYKFTTYGGNSNTDSYTKRCRDTKCHGTAFFMQLSFFMRERCRDL